MSEIASAIDTIYKKFVMRDMLSFIVPGGIVLICIFFGIGVNWSEVKTFVLELPFLAYFVLFGGLYVAGFLCQVIGSLIYRIPDLVKCRKSKNRFIHNRETDSDHLAKLREFYDVNKQNRDIMDQHERFVVLKQMVGNNGIALLLGASILLVGKALTKIETNHMEIVVIAMMFIAAILLLWAQCHQKEEQMSWEEIRSTRMRPVRKIWVRR